MKANSKKYLCIACVTVLMFSGIGILIISDIGEDTPDAMSPQEIIEIFRNSGHAEAQRWTEEMIQGPGDSLNIMRSLTIKPETKATVEELYESQFATGNDQRLYVTLIDSPDWMHAYGDTIGGVPTVTGNHLVGCVMVLESSDMLFPFLYSFSIEVVPFERETYVTESVPYEEGLVYYFPSADPIAIVFGPTEITTIGIMRNKDPENNKTIFEISLTSDLPGEDEFELIIRYSNGCDIIHFKMVFY